MASGSLHDTTSALYDAFSDSEIPQSTLHDLKKVLAAYVSKHRKSDGDAAARLQDELRTLFRAKVDGHPTKLGPFMTVLRCLRPTITAESDLVEWFELAVKPFADQSGASRASIEDGQDFVIGAMLYDEDAPDARERARAASRLASVLIDACMTRTVSPSSTSQNVSLQAQSQAALHLQNLLVAFGRKKAKDLFLALDRYLLDPRTRLQVLALLAAFLQQQQAHLYLVVHTDIVEHLLKCLMNDKATVVVSAALRCLIMLLPHIPATVAAQLPKLFLVYSRCLCWEKFSASSTKAQRDLVTDDRVRRGSDSEPALGDAEEDDDPTWTTLHSLPNMPESSAPELLHYFTYLYGLYPLNFMNYIRKPRKYLLNIGFPGADEFDLDQAVIRDRTAQFQRLHLLHPNFFTTTIEEELTDNRWLKAEPSEVISECHGLYAGEQHVLQTMPGSPGPPPTAGLPSLPPLLPLAPAVRPDQSGSGAPPSAAPERDSPTLPPVNDKDPTSPPADNISHIDATNIASDSSSTPSTSNDVLYLQRELMLLRNELTFERYLKQQHVSAIGQLKRNHVKAVTVEAETATLINANRALQKKLIDASKFNEKMQKETHARRTHTKQSEEQLTAKIRSLKADLINQETLQRDYEQACKDCDQLRQLLVESEARELGKQEEIETYEKKTESVMATLKHRDTELELSRKAFEAKTAELEARLENAESNAATVPEPSLPDVTAELQTMLADARLKLSHTKKAYAQLLNEYTDLKIRYQEIISGFGESPEGGVSDPMYPRKSHRMFQHVISDGSVQNYNPAPPRQGYYISPNYERFGSHNTGTGSSYPPTRPIHANAYPHQQGFGSVPMSRSEGASLGSGSFQHPAAWATGRLNVAGSEYDLAGAEMVHESSRSAFSANSDDRVSSKGEDKINPKSEIRVYGRGGAQNVKMKNKDKEDGKPKSPKANNGILGSMGFT
ncbi:hypothetical protein MBLNU459_g7365t1 [Dothideomycetes sp. NU459]